MPTLGPPYACSRALSVDGFVPGATIEVDLNDDGVYEISHYAPSTPLTFSLPVPLEADGKVKVRQRVGSQVSASVTQVVTKYEDLNGPLPPVPLIPEPFYPCGQRIGTYGAVVGSTLTFSYETGNGSGGWGGPQLLYYAEAPNSWLASYVTTKPGTHPDGRRVYVQQSLCGTKSTAQPVPVLPLPSELPAPTYDPAWELIVGPYSVVAFLGSLVPGATVEGYVDGVLSASMEVLSAQAALTIPGVPDGATISFRQTLCTVPASPMSIETTVAVPPAPEPGACVPPSPPRIRPPQVGDTRVEMQPASSSSRIRVYAGGVEIGDGGGRFIQLSRAIVEGDVLAIVESGLCGENPLYFEYVVECKNIDLISQRTLDGLAPATPSSFQEFESDDDHPLTDDYEAPIKGLVFYPSTTHGYKADPMLSSPLPLIVLVHGQTGRYLSADGGTSCDDDGLGEIRPAEGYIYLGLNLAAQGFIVASLDLVDLNCKFPGTDNYQNNFAARRAYVREALSFLYSTHEDTDTVLETLRPNIAEQVGLLGHSRGGDAVVWVASGCAGAPSACGLPPDLQFGGVIALGATDGSNWGYATEWTQNVVPGVTPVSPPAGLSAVPILAIVGTAERDVPSLEAMHHYERATPGGRPDWFKSTFYVHGARHNSWNSVLPADDLFLTPAQEVMYGLLSPGDHQFALIGWSLSFFLRTMKGVMALEPVFSGDALLADLRSLRAVPNYRSASQLLIHDFENGNAVNNLGSSVVFSPSPSPSQLAAMSIDLMTGRDYHHLTKASLRPWSSTGHQYSSPFPSRPFSDVKTVSFRFGPANSFVAAPLSRIKVGLTTSAGLANLALDKPQLIAPVPPYSWDFQPNLFLQTVRVPAQCLRVGGEPVPPAQAVTGFGYSLLSGSSAEVIFDDLTIE
ncbi:MAG: hypothetical protein IPG45_13175 [Deltaproteobacteria bacterium]|nr:hypothetical protein [Deltaproteobacteria bacterium]